MICEHKLTVQKNGDFLIEGEGEKEIMKSGAILTIKCKHDTVRLTLAKEKANETASAFLGQKQETDPEPKKICGACRYTPEGIVDFNQIVLCEKRGRTVPASFDGCSYFKPRTSEKSVIERLAAVIESGAEAAETSSETATEYLSGLALITQIADTEKKKETQGEADSRWTFRHTLVLPPDMTVPDFVCALVAAAPSFMPSACTFSSEVERITQLEKENSELRSKLAESDAKLNRMTETCEKGSCGIDYHRSENARLREVVESLKKENAELQKTKEHLQEELTWQFERLTDKIGMLQDQNDRLRGELDSTKRAENDSRLFWNKEHERTWQRIKELETELSERNQSPCPTRFVI